MNAHNIRRIGLAHFGGRHLSEASNECFTEEALLAADVANNADKAQSAAARNDDNAMRLQIQAQDVQDLINRRTAA